MEESTMTMTEMANTLNDKQAYLLYNLSDRWKDEKEYEDFKTYENTLREAFPCMSQATKRPFGVKIPCKDGLLHISIKNLRSGLREITCEEYKKG